MSAQGFKQWPLLFNWILKPEGLTQKPAMLLTRGVATGGGGGLGGHLPPTNSWCPPPPQKKKSCIYIYILLCQYRACKYFAAPQKSCLFHCFYAFVIMVVPAHSHSHPYRSDDFVGFFFACQLVPPEYEGWGPFGVRIYLFFIFYLFFILFFGGMSAQNFSAPYKDPRPPPPVPPYWKNPSYATAPDTHNYSAMRMSVCPLAWKPIIIEWRRRS